MIEKHFTLSRADGGVDSAFSLEPQELKSLVVESERAWQALGEVTYGPSESEKKSLIFRRSIFASANIAKGEPFTPENIRIVRPGCGAPPSFYPLLLGRTAKQNYNLGTPINIESLF